MKNLCKRLLAGATLLAGSGAHAVDGLPRFDHYDPVVLNEYALDKLGKGDVGTAAILLERAVMLAPHDTRIRRNLETLRTTQAGVRLGSPKLVDTPPPPPMQFGPVATPMPPAPYWKNENTR